MINDPLKDIQCPLGLRESLAVVTLFNRLMNMHNRSKNTAIPYPIAVEVHHDSSAKKRRTGFKVTNGITKKEVVVTVAAEEPTTGDIPIHLYAMSPYGSVMATLPFYKARHPRMVANHLFRYLQIN